MKEKKISEIVRLIPGRVVKNDFDLLDENVSLQDQFLILQEDMLHIEVTDRLTFDVGWYSKPDGGGNFIVFIIEDSDWEKPLLKIRSRSVKSLKRAINIALLAMKHEKYK